MKKLSLYRFLPMRAARVAVLTAAALLGLAGVGTAATGTDVQIVYRSYQPAQLTVAAGQTVTWKNSGLGPHTVTADAGQFNSGVLQSGETFSYTFATPGTYAYSCTIHPTMHGKVVVLAALAPGSPQAAVHVSLSTKRGRNGVLTLVHVRVSRPGARALLQLQSPRGASWSTTRRAQLSSAGAATFSLAANVHRRLRIVVQGPAGEPPLTSKTLRPSA